MRDVKEEGVIVAVEIGLFLAIVVSVTGGPGLYPATTALISMMVITIPWILRSKGKADLPWWMTLIAGVILLIHVWGITLYMYNDLWWWDKFTHLLAALVLSLFSALILISSDRWFPGTGIPPRLVPLFTLAAIISMGVFWELAEFFFDGAMGITMQYSIHDTATDLTIDIISGAVGAVLIATRIDLLESASHRIFGVSPARQ